MRLLVAAQQAPVVRKVCFEEQAKPAVDAGTISSVEEKAIMLKEAQDKVEVQRMYYEARLDVQKKAYEEKIQALKKAATEEDRNKRSALRKFLLQKKKENVELVREATQANNESSVSRIPVAQETQPQRECEDATAALMKLFKKNGGRKKEWSNDTNWGTWKPLGEWWGVDTDQSGRPKDLVLPGNGLTGELANAFPSSLVLIDISRNDLTGSIPVCLPVGLKEFSCSENKLSGTPATRLHPPPFYNPTLTLLHSS
jgi:hypothetical protein